MEAKEYEWQKNGQGVRVVPSGVGLLVTVTNQHRIETASLADDEVAKLAATLNPTLAAEVERLTKRLADYEEATRTATELSERERVHHEGEVERLQAALTAAEGREHRLKAMVAKHWLRIKAASDDFTSDMDSDAPSPEAAPEPDPRPAPDADPHKHLAWSMRQRAGESMRRTDAVITKAEQALAVQSAAPPQGAVPRWVADVMAERRTQDEQWGGAAHDDEHAAYEWLEYIDKQVRKANGVRNDDDRYRSRLVKIAALAAAAIESVDRSAAHVAPPSGGPDAERATLRFASTVDGDPLDEHCADSPVGMLRDFFRHDLGKLTGGRNLTPPYLDYLRSLDVPAAPHGGPAWPATVPERYVCVVLYEAARVLLALDWDGFVNRTPDAGDINYSTVRDAVRAAEPLLAVDASGPPTPVPHEGEDRSEPPEWAGDFAQAMDCWLRAGQCFYATKMWAIVDSIRTPSEARAREAGREELAAKVREALTREHRRGPIDDAEIAAFSNAVRSAPDSIRQEMKLLSRALRRAEALVQPVPGWEGARAVPDALAAPSPAEAGRAATLRDVGAYLRISARLDDDPGAEAALMSYAQRIESGDYEHTLAAHVAAPSPKAPGPCPECTELHDLATELVERTGPILGAATQHGYPEPGEDGPDAA